MRYPHIERIRDVLACGSAYDTAEIAALAGCSQMRVCTLIRRLEAMGQAVIVRVDHGWPTVGPAVRFGARARYIWAATGSIGARSYLRVRS